MKKLNQEFSNYIEWIDTPAEEIIHQYFDNNCQRINDKNFEKCLLQALVMNDAQNKKQNPFQK
ncbi:4569_t:CDS:2, partial [Funneliformis geosporum]